MITASATRLEAARRLAPFAVAASMPFVLLTLPPAHWQAFKLFVAAGLTISVAASVVLIAPNPRRHSLVQALGALTYLAVVGLLRDAGEGSAAGVGPLVLLPVFWLALYGSRRQLLALLPAVVAVFVVPIVIVGGSSYPVTTWRVGVMYGVIGALLGLTVQALIARIREQTTERQRLVRQLDLIAHTDALTGLPNRRSWQAELTRALDRARRTAEPLAVAIVDLDEFKAINDRHGHQAGDRLLVRVAQDWLAELRPDDVLARVGGDEFMLLLPACPGDDAAAVLDRLRLRTPSPHTCSAGIAVWDGRESATELTHRADLALYRAKRHGRDRVTAHA